MNLPEIEINETLIDDKYEFYDKDVGSGYSGDLLLCRNKETKKKFIMKSLVRNERSLYEMRIQKYLKSEFVVDIIDIFQDDDYYYIVMEYARDGDLHSYFDDKVANETMLIDIMYCISQLLKFIHSKGIVHADLKLENILIVNNRLKLCDFGFSKFSDEPAKKYYYTIPYTAPEQLSSLQYDTKVDIWALGVMSYYIYFEDFPFNIDKSTSSSISASAHCNQIRLELQDKTLRFSNEKQLSNEIKELIQKMLEIDPIQRYSIDQVIDKINMIKNEIKNNIL